MSSLPPPPGQPPSEPAWPSYPGSGVGPAPAPGYGQPPSVPPGYPTGYGQPPSMPPGYQAYGTGHLPRASFGQRLGAALVDGVVNIVMMLPFSVAFYVLLDKALENCFTIENSAGKDELQCGPGGELLNVGPLVASIVCLVLGIIVVAYMHCRWVGRGQTPGQRALNIRVVDANSGQSIGMGRAFGRYLFRSFISGTVCLLGYLWMLWDPNKQTWHDKVVNAVVVQTN